MLLYTKTTSRAGAVDWSTRSRSAPSSGLVAVLGLVFALGFASPSSATIEEGPYFFGNSVYWLLAPQSWTAADAEVATFGLPDQTHLVTLNTAEENAYLAEIFLDPVTVTGFYTGYNDLTTEGVYEWTSVVQSSYTNWAPGEPNGGAAENAAQVQDNLGGQWNDVQEFLSRYAVAERFVYRRPVRYNGHDYYLLAPKTWFEAEAEAVGLGGHLVTIDDAAENDFVVEQFLDDVLDVWIGYNDTDVEGTYVWSSGSTSTYTNWRPGEPSDSAVEDAARIQSDVVGYGGWNDVTPAALTAGVAEVVRPDVADPIRLFNGGFEAPDISGASETVPDGWVWNGLGTVEIAEPAVDPRFLGENTFAADGDQLLLIGGDAAIGQVVGSGELQPSRDYGFVFDQAYALDSLLGDRQGRGVSIELWDGHPFAGGTLLDDQPYFPVPCCVDANPRFAILQSGPNATPDGDAWIVLRVNDLRLDDGPSRPVPLDRLSYRGQALSGDGVQPLEVAIGFDFAPNGTAPSYEEDGFIVSNSAGNVQFFVSPGDGNPAPSAIGGGVGNEFTVVAAPGYDNLEFEVVSVDLRDIFGAGPGSVATVSTFGPPVGGPAAPRAATFDMYPLTPPYANAVELRIDGAWAIDNIVLRTNPRTMDSPRGEGGLLNWGPQPEYLENGFSVSTNTENVEGAIDGFGGVGSIVPENPVVRPDRMKIEPSFFEFSNFAMQSLYAKDLFALESAANSSFLGLRRPPDLSTRVKPMSGIPTGSFAKQVFDGPSGGFTNLAKFFAEGDLALEAIRMIQGGNQERYARDAGFDFLYDDGWQETDAGGVGLSGWSLLDDPAGQPGDFSISSYRWRLATPNATGSTVGSSSYPQAFRSLQGQPMRVGETFRFKMNTNEPGTAGGFGRVGIGETFFNTTTSRTECVAASFMVISVDGTYQVWVQDFNGKPFVDTGIPVGTDIEVAAQFLGRTLDSLSFAYTIVAPGHLATKLASISGSRAPQTFADPECIQLDLLSGDPASELISDYVEVARNPSGFLVEEVASSVFVGSLAAAEALLDGTQANSGESSSFQYELNLSTSGPTGSFPSFDGAYAFGGTYFALRATGRVFIPHAGDWTFGTTNDDGVRVRIDGQDVIVDDSPHPPQTFLATVNLDRGWHDLELVHFETGAGAELELFAAPGSQVAFGPEFELVGRSNGLLVSLPRVGACPVHRWRFDEPAGPALDGTIVQDVLCGADGVVRGSGAAWTGDEIELPGGTPATAGYVDLPNGLISGKRNVTFEAWYTLEGSNFWGKVFDFGASNDQEIPPGTGGGGSSYVFHIPMVGSDIDQQRTGISNSGFSNQDFVDTAVPSNTGQRYHLAVTIDADAGSAGDAVVTTYRNGFEVSQFTTSVSLDDILDVNNWLGRSNFTGDNSLQGRIAEFRLYDRALDSLEIQTSYYLGPDVDVLGVPEPGFVVGLLSGAGLLGWLDRRRRRGVRSS